MEDPYKIFRILIKFMDERYLDSFLNDGLLFMNNIHYFRELEDTNVALRGDVHEGLAATYNAESLTITFGDHVAEGAIGKVDIRYNHEDNTNIYSMTRISDGKILEAGNSGFLLSEKFKQFGNRAVVIGGSKIVEFERRLRNAILKDRDIYTLREDKVLAKQVSYISRKEHHGKMDVFNKFSEYSWQHEWRIALKHTKPPGPFQLKIGKLSDIADVFETELLISDPIRLMPIDL
ncbi:hypothetical protein ACE1BU_05870 [Aeromonas veronii]|uniref:hypothetical protein n=1 Tax=Aeromonas veronii TaxID=654 RepID=UPI0035B71938